MGNAKPLATIYEPEPEKPVESASTVPAATATKSGISDEMKKSSYWYIESKLNIWTQKEADAELVQRCGTGMP